MVSFTSGTENSAEPTMNLRPVPTPPSAYPRTLFTPPMANASYGGRSPTTFPPLAANVNLNPFATGLTYIARRVIGCHVTQ